MKEAGEFNAYQQAVGATSRVLLVGLIAPIAFALQASTFAQLVSVLGVAAVLIGSAFGLGGALGFLFGIPRSLQDPAFVSTPPTGAAGTPNRAAVARYAGNTSLEQISDWLTKILVGVGLTQLTNLPSGLSALAAFLAPSLGGFASSGTFGVLLATFYAIGGLFLTYMWTRLYMALLLAESDSVAGRFSALAENVTSQRQTEQRALRNAVGSAVNSMVSTLAGSFTQKPSNAEVKKLTTQAISTATEELERQQVLIDISRLKPTSTEPVRVSADNKTTVAELLNVTFIAFADVVAPYTYGISWILEDAATGTKFDQIGTTFAQRNLKREFDDRPLADVGIVPGMRLTATLLNQ
jgi:hypothetical protein